MGHSLLNLTELPRLQRTELPVLQLVSPSNRPIQISNLSKNGFPKVVQKRVRLNVDTSPEATKLAVPSRSCPVPTDIAKRRSTVRKHFFVNAAAASISQSVKLSGKSPKSERRTKDYLILGDPSSFSIVHGSFLYTIGPCGTTRLHLLLKVKSRSD